MKKLFLAAVFAAGLGALCAKTPEIKVPLVEKNWINDKVLTYQGATPWSFAAVLHTFVDMFKPGQDAKLDTQARIFHDRNKLYFGFFRTVEKAASCVTEKRDGSVWEDDSVMLFIAPDAANPKHYYQIIINANGVVYDEEYFPNDTANVKKDFSTLKYHIFKGERAWLIYASIDLKELGIVPGKKFNINLASHRKETDGTEEYTTWAPLARPRFLCPESFITASLGGKNYTKPASYTFGKYPEFCLDGEGEFGSNERWQRRNGASISPWYKASGTNSVSVSCKDPGKVRNWFHALDLKGNTRYMLKFYAKYGTLVTGNHVPIRIHCFDKNNKRIAIIDGPGLGNLGGGVPTYTFSPYKKDFTTPAGTVRAELEIRMVDVGGVNLDMISVRPFVPVVHIPQLLSPAENSFVRSSRVVLKWKLFARDDLRPGTLTLQFSKDASFPKDKTLTFDGCAYDPNDRNGWYEDLPEQGKWFWRAKFDGEDGGVWSKPASFTVEYDASNEKIAPVIGALNPRGRMVQRAKEYRIPFCDGKISSGIKSVQLLLNRQDVTASAKIDDRGITFTLPEDGKDFYEVQLFVADNNGSKAEENDFIAIMPGKGNVAVDAKGFITVDGKRIFPIAGYAYDDNREFPLMKKYGFSSNFTPWVTPSSPACWRIIADCWRAGLYMIPISLPDYLWGKGYVPTDSRAARRFLQREILACAKLQGHPGVVGFYLGDESIDGGYKMERFQEYHRELKRLCPDIPTTWLPTYGQNNKFAWEGAKDACDLLWHDDYVIQHSTPLYRMIFDIERIMKWSKNKPFIEILGAHAPTSDWNKKVQRFPSYDAMRYCVWASTIMGSKGMAVYVQGIRKTLQYNPYADTNAPETQENIGKILRELQDNIPWIVSDELPKTATRVLTGEVRILERVANGKTMVAVVNAGEKPASVKIGSGKVIDLDKFGMAIEFY